jgi:hypothetical protein
VSAKSAPGEGMAVTVRLPVLSEDDEPDLPPETVAASGSPVVPPAPQTGHPAQPNQPVQPFQTA